MYQALLQKVVLPINDILSGTDIVRRWRFYERSQWWERDDIERFQNMKLEQLISHAYKNVPYYKKLFDKNKIDPSRIKKKEHLEEIPYLTKEIIQKNPLEDFLSKKDKKRGMLKQTGGSTGKISHFTEIKIPIALPGHHFFVTVDGWGMRLASQCSFYGEIP